MIIHTANCKLRTFKSDDVEAFYNLVHDEAVEKYVRYACCKNIKQARISVSDYMLGDCKNDFYLVIEKNGIMVGCIIAVKIKKGALDVSVCIGKDFRGQGIMLEAMNGFILWLKENTEYLRLDIAINMSNSSSLKLIDKIGAELFKLINDTYYYRIYLR